MENAEPAPQIPPRVQTPGYPHAIAIRWAEGHGAAFESPAFQGRKAAFSISKTGIVTANAPGTETVTISYGGQSTKVKVKVNPEG